MACGILVPQPGMKPVPPAVEEQTFNFTGPPRKSLFFLPIAVHHVRWSLIMILIYISLMINNVEHFSIYLLAICISFFEKCLFRYSILKSDCLLFFSIELYEFFIYFGCNTLPDTQFATIFSRSVGCLFILLMNSFAVQKLFSLM